MHHELTSNGVYGKPAASTAAAAVAFKSVRLKPEDDYLGSRKSNESTVSSQMRRTDEMVGVEVEGRRRMSSPRSMRRKQRGPR